MTKSNRYLKIAKEVSSWSKDPSSKIGAVLVGKHGQIISQGYNGFARGVEDSERRLNDRELKYKYIVHAEANAIYNAIHNGATTADSTLYIYGLPICCECTKAVIQSGVKKVVMCFSNNNPDNVGRWMADFHYTETMCNEAGVELEIIEDLE